MASSSKSGIPRRKLRHLARYLRNRDCCARQICFQPFKMITLSLLIFSVFTCFGYNPTTNVATVKINFYNFSHDSSSSSSSSSSDSNDTKHVVVRHGMHDFVTSEQQLWRYTNQPRVARRTFEQEQSNSEMYREKEIAKKRYSNSLFSAYTNISLSDHNPIGIRSVIQPMKENPNAPYNRKYNITHPFVIRIVGIFVADSELPYTLELAKPAIDIAIEKAKTLYPTTKWEDAVFRNGSNRCTANLAGVFAAEEFYLRRVTVFIGPSCGLALDPVARMAAHWRIPVISSGGPHVQFSNKDIFSTLTRLSFSLTNLGLFVSQIFHLFNWTHVSLIVQDKPSSPLIPLMKETIVDAFDETEVFLEMHEISRTLAKTNLKNLLVECAKEARIIFILASGETVRQVLLSAFELGMGEGGYVFLTVELFKHRSSFGNFDWFVRGDARNEDVKHMYESLFILTVKVPMSDIYQQFAEDLVSKSRTEFNTSFTSKDVNVILAGFHDSVILYGKAVSDVIEEGGDPLDGLQVIRHIWNRTFTDYLSGDIYINSNGDKETDYTLKDFNPDSLEMRSVINYSGREDKIVWINFSSIHWPQNWIPSSDVTRCQQGIRDLYCNKSDSTFPLLDISLGVGLVLVLTILVLFYIYRKMRLESELTSLWWKIRWNEIIFIHNQSDRSIDTTKQMYSNFVSSTTQVSAVAAEPEASSIGQMMESGSKSSHKSNSAPQSITHNFISRFDQSKVISGQHTSGAVSHSGSICSTTTNRSKPHIRINDYFALPTYFHHLSGNRANRAVNFAQKHSSSCDKCNSSATTPSKNASLSVQSGPSGAGGSSAGGGGGAGGAHCSLHAEGHKQLSSESLAQIPNKGLYKGSKVFIKHLNIKHFTINREILIELKQLKDLAHENLIRFVGICAEDQHISILTEFCEKGNLRDLLDNEGIRIDWPFRYSLINDIVEGMLFIHESSLSYHGSLKSTNLVIDSRLVVKLTDFGLKTLRNLSKQNSGQISYKSLLWTSPEHLRQRKPELHGSQKGDVYSFSIVLQEIITRSGPFETVKVVGGDGKYSVVSLDPQFIIQQLKLGGATPYRPNVDQHECLPELNELLTQCWDENPNNRPSFQSIRSQIGKIAKEFVGGSGNSFLENLLLRLEQYANDLEILVEQKTSAFFEEKKKCEELLYELLPRTVADQLKRGNQVKPESFQCVTIFFSDIVKFTQIAAASTPIEIVDFLNDLYTLFDSIIASYDVYKVETVGDAYLVVSGLPVRNGNEHARQIARMSLELLTRIKQFEIKHLADREVKLRIGIHSGPCAAGVIGLKMPRYCLFGDTVNTASRMESHGEPNKIHTSETTKHILEKFGTFHLTLRGDIYLKGKGVVRTYWLESEQNQLVNRYRFLSKKMDDNIFESTDSHGINDSKESEDIEMTEHSYYASGNSYHNSNPTMENATNTSAVVDETILGMQDNVNDEQSTPLLNKSAMAKSAST